MKALILSAGEGKRMRPLTDTMPKPLLQIGECSLLEHHLVKLKKTGITDIVINTGYLGDMIIEAIGDGSRYGVNIRYLPQKELLDSGGDTLRALELLDSDPFIFVSADVYTDYDFASLTQDLSAGSLGRLMMVPIPDYHPQGHYGLGEDGYLTVDGEKWNWGSLGFFHPDLFKGAKEESFPLINMFDTAVQAGRLEGDLYTGIWFNISTPEDLAEVRSRFE